MCADFISWPTWSVGGQDAGSNLSKICATSLGWDLGKTLTAGGFELSHRVTSDEAAVVAICKALVHVNIMRRVEQVACDPEILGANFLRPLWS